MQNGHEEGNSRYDVLADIDSQYETDFNALYNQEHMPERLSLSGFLNAARYEALSGGPRYLAVYELESVAALQSDEYLRLSQNSSEWTTRILFHRHWP